MGVTHYLYGDEYFRQVISRNYKALSDLRDEYMKINRKTWLNLSDMETGEFSLTILI